MTEMDGYYQLFNLIALGFGVMVLGVIILIGVAVSCVKFGYKMGIGGDDYAMTGLLPKRRSKIVDRYLRAGETRKSNKNSEPFIGDEDPWENSVLNSRTAKATIPGDQGGRK